MKAADLKANKNTLASEFGMDAVHMTAVIELIEKGKIAKPEKLFKDCAPKLDIKGPINFMYINMGQKNYYFHGAAFPVGSGVKRELSLVKKALAKAKEKDKEFLQVKEYFLQELQKLDGKIKGHAAGIVKFHKADGNVCFMKVKAGVQVGGKTKKNALADAIKDIGYDLMAKNKQVMQFLPVKEDAADDNESSDSNNDLNSAETLTTNLKGINAEYKEALVDHDADQINDLLAKITKWNQQYKKLDAKEKNKLDKANNKAKELATELKKIHAIDLKIDDLLEQIYPQMEKYVDIDDHDSDKAITLKAKVEKNIAVLEKYAKQINDLDFLEACSEFRIVMNS